MNSPEYIYIYIYTYNHCDIKQYFHILNNQGCSLSAGAKFGSCKTHANSNLQEPSWFLQNLTYDYNYEYGSCKRANGSCKTDFARAMTVNAK